MTEYHAAYREGCHSGPASALVAMLDTPAFGGSQVVSTRKVVSTSRVVSMGDYAPISEHPVVLSRASIVRWLVLSLTCREDRLV